MLASNRFSRDKLIEILDATKDRTLGEVDKNNVFRKTITKPKITGIAGDVIEPHGAHFLSEVRDGAVDAEIVEEHTDVDW